MSIPDFYSLMEGTGTESESSKDSTPDFYSLMEKRRPEISKSRSVLSALGKAPIQAATSALKAVPFLPRGPVSYERGEELVNELLPTRPERTEQVIERGAKLAPFVAGGEAGIPLRLAELGLGTAAGQAAQESGVGETGQALAEAGGLGAASLAKAGGKAAGKLFASKEVREAAKQTAKLEKLQSAAAKSPEKQTLLNFAQEHGLTPEETNLLFHSEGKAEYLSHLGRKTKRFKKVVQGLKDKLGKNYEELKELGKTGGHLNLNEAEGLTDNLGKILSEMTASPYIGHDVKPVINSLESTIQNINNKPHTIKELISARQGVSQDINWKNIDQGDLYRKQVRDAFLDTIEKKNPGIGKRVADTDKAWAKFEKFENVLEKKIPTFKFKGVEIPSGFLEAVAFFGAPFFPFGKSVALGIVVKNIAQRIATEIAVNPKFQEPLKTLQKAMLSGNTLKQKQAWIVIKQLVKKEDPELYDDIKDVEIE